MAEIIDLAEARAELDGAQSQQQEPTREAPETNLLKQADQKAEQMQAQEMEQDHERE